MSNNNLQKKANIIFYQIVGIGFGFSAAIVFLIAIMYPKFVLVAKSMMHRLEVICGCSNHFSFANHPIIFSFIILTGLLLIVLSSAIVIRIIRLRRSTKKYINANLNKRKKVISSKLKNVSQLVGTKGKIIEIDDESPVIFSFGYFKPMICISSSLVKKLQKKELAAVLLHEKHHVENYEPLKIFVVKVLAKFSMFLPGIKLLSQQYLTLSEITADQQATDNFKNRGPLARALCKYVKLSERVVLKNNLAISYFSPTTQRINKLIGDKNVTNFKAFTPQILISVFVILFSLFSFNAVLGSQRLTEAKHSVEMCEEMENMSNNQCEDMVVNSECELNYSLDDTCS